MKSRHIFRRAARSRLGVTVVVSTYTPDEVRVALLAAGLKCEAQMTAAECIGLGQLLTLAGEAAGPVSAIPTAEAAESDFATYQAVALDSQKKAHA